MERIEHLIENYWKQYLFKSTCFAVIDNYSNDSEWSNWQYLRNWVIRNEQVSIIVPNVQNFVVDGNQSQEKQTTHLRRAPKVVYELNISDENPDEEETPNDADEILEEDIKLRRPAESEKEKLQIQLPFIHSGSVLFDEQKPEVFDPLSDVPTLSQTGSGGRKKPLSMRKLLLKMEHSETKNQRFEKSRCVFDKFMFINELFREMKPCMNKASNHQ